MGAGCAGAAAVRLEPDRQMGALRLGSGGRFAAPGDRPPRGHARRDRSTPAGERSGGSTTPTATSSGRWITEAFGGAPLRPVAEELGRAYDAGLNLGRSMAVMGRSTDEGASIYVLRGGRPAASDLPAIARQAWLGGLSARRAAAVLPSVGARRSRHPGAARQSISIGANGRRAPDAARAGSAVGRLHGRFPATSGCS